MNDISFLMSFLGGLLYFFSPCILPLVPSFLSFISGISFQDMKNNPALARSRVVLYTAFFLVGFSFIFISLGLGASFLGDAVLSLKFPVQKLGGSIIIILGLYLLLHNKLKFSHSFSIMPKKKPAGIIGALFIGVVFAFSFTACATPYLAAVLTVAGIKANMLRGLVLLLFFSLGLSVPFLISAVSLSWFLSVFDKIKGKTRLLEITAGLILIFFGTRILITGI
ncbi:MAG TPA: cytochrome c biogenesis protein CcdA [Candidatus Omnitrophica bacterium]|nr:cytochrome c biogenesis protein CcdA [Candidatus Omnitrophota bacterium]